MRFQAVTLAVLAGIWFAGCGSPDQIPELMKEKLGS